MVPELRPPSSPTELAAFIVFAALAVLGALGTVFLRNPIRCAMGLFVHILALSGLYLTLSAHFLGVIQLLVYAGAVVVLFVFVIMLLGPAADTPRDSKDLFPRILAAACVVGAALLVVPNVGYVRMVLPARPEAYGTLKQVGDYLFNDAVIPFELISVTLVVAVVGAFAIARGHHKKRLGLTLADEGEPSGGRVVGEPKAHITDKGLPSAGAAPLGPQHNTEGRL